MCAIACHLCIPYNTKVTRPDPDRIRKVLRDEVAEFKAPGGVAGLFNSLLMLVASVGLSSVVGSGFFWIFAAMMEMDYEDSTIIVAMVCSPILGFILGYLTRDSLLLPGHTNRTASDYEIGEDNELLGCLFYFLHMLGSSVYHSVTQLLNGFGKDRSKELELAVSIVSHLLIKGQAPTAKLADSLIDQGVPRERVRDTLVLLREQRVIEPDENLTRLSPSIKPLLGPI